MVISQDGKGLAIVFILILGCVVAAKAMCGNQELMDAARKKAFVVNEQVVRQIGSLIEPAQISLKGRVKQLADGTLHIVIDELDTNPGVESAKFPFAEGAAFKPIDYVIFEEIPAVDR